MKYPRKSQYLSFEKISKNTYKVWDQLTDAEWNLGYYPAKLLYALDGKTSPEEICPEVSREQIDYWMETFEEEGMLDDGKRLTVLGFGCITFTLIKPKCNRKTRMIAKVCNRVLVLSWLPILLSGVSVSLLNGLMKKIESGWSLGEWMKGLIIGLLVGVVFHEIAHAIAGLSCKHGQVYEFGLSLHRFLPGAYTMVDHRKVSNRYKRIQILAAGVEMNFLICGICLITANIFPVKGLFFLAAAIENAFLAVQNLSLIDGLDGERIFAELFGEAELLDKAKSVVKSRKKRKILRQKGVNGKAVITASYFLIGIQYMLPVWMIMSLISVLEGFE